MGKHKPIAAHSIAIVVAINFERAALVEIAALQIANDAGVWRLGLLSSNKPSHNP